MRKLLLISFLRKQVKYAIKQTTENVPESAAATSRMFLKWVRRYSPRAREAVKQQSSENQNGVSILGKNLTFFGIGGEGCSGVANLFQW